jgi:hypothetical protein
LEAKQAGNGDGSGGDHEAKPTVCRQSAATAGDEELIEAELTRLGYPVLPDKPLPDDEVEYVTAVEACWRVAAFDHLVGENYGVVPDGPTSKSIVMLQNELAVSRAGMPTRWLIWLPKGTRSDRPEQQAFIDTLIQDAQAQFGADLLMGDIEIQDRDPCHLRRSNGGTGAGASSDEAGDVGEDQASISSVTRRIEGQRAAAQFAGSKASRSRCRRSRATPLRSQVQSATPGRLRCRDAFYGAGTRRGSAASTMN